MDLLGDLGASDQLTSTRAENAVLKERVKKLESQCKILTVENESLKAEVEMYRNDAANNASSDGGGTKASQAGDEVSADAHEDFVVSGDGVYTSSCELTLEDLHGSSNILSCSLSHDDTVLATGGADSCVALCQWGAGLSDVDLVKPIKVDCGAPVIAMDFGRKSRFSVIAAGCMDGSVHLIQYKTPLSGLEAEEVCAGTIKHAKYVKLISWLANDTLVATAAADGSVQIHKVTVGFEPSETNIEKVQSLQLPGPIEAMCFVRRNLCCYARGSPCLNFFGLDDGYKQRKLNLNQGVQGAANFDEHVSYCVMDMSVSPKDDKYLALATDTSRNIILDWETGRQARNLYGHTNDGYSNPKLAWSHNGQYLIGNTQAESSACVWDIASSSITNHLSGHTNLVRDMYSSPSTDTLITTSFDRKTKIWMTPVAP